MTITRRKIEVPTVESKMLADNTGYVAVSEFDAVTVEQFEKAIDELIINAILEVDYGQSSAEDALTSLAQKLNENIASNYQ